jgi:hypothetical protein
LLQVCTQKGTVLVTGVAVVRPLDHMEFLGEGERSEWLTGDDKSVEMASASLFTARWGKVKILRAPWVSGEMVLWRRKKMLLRIHFGHWVGLVIVEAAAMAEEWSSRVGLIRRKETGE